MKQNGVFDDALRLSLFPYYLTHHATAWQSPLGLGSLPSNIVANLRGDLKAITTLSGVAYDGPTIPPTPSPLLKEVERETEATKDKPNPKPSIPYPSRINDQKLREKANNQMLKFLQIFQRLHFDISFVDALLHMPKSDSTFKSLLSNKEKLFELASTPLNENCSVVLLKKLPEKLGDLDKFPIPCDFLELEECLALADLGASEAEEPSSLQDAPPISNRSPSSWIASQVIDLDRSYPYTPHPPIGLLGIASMTSLVLVFQLKKLLEKGQKLMLLDTAAG
nr:reverse transcriptase domain-containing protein [Tanacetum cinerariifolium]